LTDNDPKTDSAFKELEKEGSVRGKAVMTEKQVEAVAELIHCVLAQRAKKIREVAERNIYG